MGYTHYFKTDNWDKQDENGWINATKIIRKIFKKYDNIIQRDYEDNRKPVCSQKQICFNGIEDDGHETFVIFNKEDQGVFSFCKTARKPYDIVVCEILLVINALCPHFSLTSDGFSGYLDNPEIDGEWANAIENVKEYGISYYVEVISERKPYCDFLPILDSIKNIT